MPDRRTDADRFGDWLDAAPTGRPEDDLARFAAEVLREGSLPSSSPLTDDQRARIRARVSDAAVRTISSEETPAMTPHAFSANGAVPAARPVALPTPPTDHPAPTWPSLLTTAALVAIIAIAALALARGPLDLIPINDGPAPTGAPGVVQAPDATPVPASGCDLTADIPVVTGRDILPFDRTLLVLEGGTLALHCDGTSTEIIASGVTGVRATGWPGAIVVTTTDGTLRGMNLLTGATIGLGPEPMPTEGDGERLFFGAVSRWLFLPTDAELSDWRVVDLLAMEALVISDVPGATLPDRSIPFPRTSAGETTLAVSFHEEPSPTNATTALPTPHADATAVPVLVVDGSLDTVRWTEAAPGYIAATSLSRDGRLLALTREAESGLTVDVQRTSDGEAVVETGIALDDGEGDDDDFLGLYGADQFLLLDDEAGLLHLSRFQLDLVTWNDAGETQTTTVREFDAEEGAPVLYATADPAIVIVAMGYGDFGRNAYRVDVATGATTELTNLIGETMEPISNNTTLPRYGLVAVPTGPNDARTIVRMVDLISGEVVAESDPIEITADRILGGVTRANGTVGFILDIDGTATVLDAASGQTFGVTWPEGAAQFWQLSSDGSIAVTYSAPIVDEDTEGWIAEIGPDTAWIAFDPGLGEIPAIITGAHALPDDPTDT